MRPLEGTESIGIIEIAKISGLELVPVSLRNVMRTTNHGIGDVLKQLKSEGIRKVILGLGGSSTIDAGMSILYALPCFRFQFDDERRPKFLTGADLGHIRGIEKTGEYRNWADLDITTACDVKNTLLGPEGAVYMFGQQKGLQTLQAPEYEETMRRLAVLAGAINNIEGLAALPYTGAAGGVLIGLKAAFPATSSLSGFDLISQVGHLPLYVSQSDFVFTGEGKYDTQTSLGKVVHKIRTLRSDAIIICGQNTTSDTRLTFDFASRFGLKEALNNSAECLRRVVDEIVTGRLAKM